MFNHTGLVTVFRPNWRQKKKLPKLLVAVFVLIQIIFGINNGFFAAMTNKCLIEFGNIGSALSFLLIMIAYVYHVFVWDWASVLFAFYYLCIFITMLVSKYTLYHFLQDLMALDARLNFETNLYVSVKTLVFLLFACGLKVLMSVLIGLEIGFLDNGAIFLIMYLICELRNVLPIVVSCVNVLIFKVIYLRLQFLKVCFDQRELQTREIALIYKALAECLSKIRASQDTLVVLEFVANFVKCVTFVWAYLKFLKGFPDLLIIVIRIADTFLLIMLICLPAVFAERIAAQIDEINLLANERLLTETDENNRKELLLLLRYVKARPLTRAAWRLVPVDLRLPVSLLSMTATYVIVLVQLTHLY